MNLFNQPLETIVKYFRGECSPQLQHAVGNQLKTEGHHDIAFDYVQLILEDFGLTLDDNTEEIIAAVKYSHTQAVNTMMNAYRRAFWENEQVEQDIDSLEDYFNRSTSATAGSHVSKSLITKRKHKVQKANKKHGSSWCSLSPGLKGHKDKNEIILSKRNIDPLERKLPKINTSSSRFIKSKKKKSNKTHPQQLNLFDEYLNQKKQVGRQHKFS